MLIQSYPVSQKKMKSNLNTNIFINLPVQRVHVRLYVNMILEYQEIYLKLKQKLIVCISTSIFSNTIKVESSNFQYICHIWKTQYLLVTNIYQQVSKISIITILNHHFKINFKIIQTIFCIVTDNLEKINILSKYL